ncbi:rRNA-processing protein UTP23 -like protein [Trichinella nelsoni]|uniref:rRNA-processing protein UTP23 homolog n=1 Tax=Trichinella nelsoni TaxID=6336 RepID=A0A0V0RXY0_9BILA|nr:rRNA-processing protein UTP23 -like protein [Trichinella nelsoni]
MADVFLNMLRISGRANQNYQDRTVKMKIRRYKKAQRVLSFLKHNFSFVAPYRIVVDGTFCQAALENKVNIREQIQKYLQEDVLIYTTACVLQELELLGGHFHGALLIAKQYKCLKCKHMVQKEKPCSASMCLQKLVGKENSKKYFIATQDKDLRAVLNEKVAACPLLFLQQKVIHLDRLSQVCKEKADREIESKLNFESSKDTVAMLKNKLLPKSYSKKKDENFIRRKPKAPNPLSCLKKKKKNMTNNVLRSDGKRTRRRRRRGNNMNAVVQDASSCFQ